MSKRRRKSRRRSSSKNQMGSSGNGPFSKLSKKVFRKTGMPLSRLIFVALGLIMIGGLIYYSVRERESTAETSEDLSTSIVTSNQSNAEKFLRAVSVPNDFPALSLPVRLEVLEEMISKCKSLLNEDTVYTSRVQEKLISLSALQCVTLSQAGIEAGPSLKELARMTALFSDTDSNYDSSMTLAFAYLTSLSFSYTPENYEAAFNAINQIDETTPGTNLKVSGCCSQAIQLFKLHQNDEKILELVDLFGRKLAANKEASISDAGFALLDYPIFAQFYKRPNNLVSSQTDNDNDYEMLKQAIKTPPQSPHTINVILKIPEQSLQDGNIEAANKMLAQVQTIISRCPERLRNDAEPKWQKLAKRIGLFEKPFVVDGSDAKGVTLKSNPNKQSVILFFSPTHPNSRQAVVTLNDSPIHEPWTTDFFAVPVKKLSEDGMASWQKKFPDITFLDYPTAKDWIEKSGMSHVPYQIILDKDDTVARVGKP